MFNAHTYRFQQIITKHELFPFLFLQFLYIKVHNKCQIINKIQRVTKVSTPLFEIKKHPPSPLTSRYQNTSFKKNQILAKTSSRKKHTKASHTYQSILVVYAKAFLYRDPSSPSLIFCVMKNDFFCFNYYSNDDCFICLVLKGIFRRS